MARPSSMFPRIHVRKRGSWYSLDNRHRGRRWWEATGTARRSEADAAADRRRRELAAAAGADPAAHPQAYSVAEAAADFLKTVDGIADGTKKMYGVKARHLARLLGPIDLTQLGQADTDRYVKARRDEGAKDHTIAKELVTLRRVLSYAEQAGRVGPTWRSAVARRFRAGYAPRDRWLTEEEFLRLHAAMPDERRLWLVAAVYLGGRDSELSAIDWRDVDLRQGFVRLYTAKHKHGDAPRPRHIPLAGALRALLEAVPEKARKGRVLPVWRNSALMVTKYAQKAGIVAPPVYEMIPGKRGKPVRGKMLEHGGCLSPNDLRRTFASWLLQRGATVAEVAALMGHGSISMVSRVYGHLAAANLVSAVARLPEFPATDLLPKPPAQPAQSAGSATVVPLWGTRIRT